MRYTKVCIEAFGHVVPDQVLSSAEIEGRLEEVYKTLRLPKGRIEEMTGIKERRLWPQGTPPSQSSTLAARRAIEAAGIPASEIGALVHCSVCRDHLEPATSTIVHANLDLPKTGVIFDISNACLGFLNGILTVANMIELGQIRAGVVVASENGGPVATTTIEALAKDPAPTRKKFKDYFASLTIGSGSVAAVLTHESVSRAGHRLLAGAYGNASEHNGLCRCTPDHAFADETHPLMETDSLSIMEHGCNLAKGVWERLRATLGWENSTPDRIFCHQIGTSHRAMLFKTLGLDPAKDFSTVEWLGNTGSVALPITFSMGIEKGRIKAGETAALLGIGSGLSSVMLGVRW